jgi:hypothetical protein
MIKIIFEVSEDFIRENASPEATSAKMKAASEGRAMKVLFDMIGFSQLNKQIEQGKTEFMVTPDKLDDKSMELFNNEIGEICVLAAFSETDKKDEKKESN